MYKKVCPECNVESYSAAQSGKWICPNCNKNLEDIKCNNNLIEEEKEDEV